MGTKLQQTTENCTIINGAVLTNSVIKRIADFQENENENVQSCRDTLANAVCFIGRNLDSTENKTNEIRDLITDLSYIRDYFLDFKKP